MYELRDLGYGRCTMVLAGKAGPDPAAEALRRLGVMRVATKYPRIAARHLEETGRQAEIVEVKGSVELAPLTGIVEAIVDLTATGTTLRENNLVVREEILECSARLIANPVSYKLKAAEIDELRRRMRALPDGPASSEMELLRLSESDVAGLGGPVGAAARVRALVPAGESVAGEVAEIIAAVRERGDAALGELTARFDTGGREPAPLLVEPEELDEAIRQMPLELVAGLQVAIANVAQVADAGAGQDASLELPQGQRLRLREVPVASAAVYVPGGRAPYPSTVVMGVVTARAAGVLDVRVCARRPDRTARSTPSSSAPAASAAWSASTGWVARRPSPRWPTAPRPSRPST